MTSSPFIASILRYMLVKRARHGPQAETSVYSHCQLSHVISGRAWKLEGDEKQVHGTACTEASYKRRNFLTSKAKRMTIVSRRCIFAISDMHGGVFSHQAAAEYLYAVIWLANECLAAGDVSPRRLTCCRENASSACSRCVDSAERPCVHRSGFSGKSCVNGTVQRCESS